MTDTTLTKSAAFWDGIAQKYARDPIRDMAAYETTLDRTRAYLRPEDRVLEMGCGTASTAIRLASDVAHITASDVSTEMVEIGREKVWNESLRNVDNVQGVIGDPGLDGPYDAILAFNLLHLIPETEAAIAKAYAQLPRGGYFISKTPCLGERKNWLRPVVWAMQLVRKAPDVRFLRIVDVERMIVGAGFKIVEAGDYPRSFPSHFVVAQKP